MITLVNDSEIREEIPENDTPTGRVRLLRVKNGGGCLLQMEMRDAFGGQTYWVAVPVEAE